MGNAGLTAKRRKIRNPKHEIRNNLKTQSKKSQNKNRPDAPFEFSAFLTFEFVSDFDIRISDFHPSFGLRAQKRWKIRNPVVPHDVGKENSVFFGIVSALKSASWLLTGLLAYHGSIRAEKAVIRC
ncbi:MAG TPA: hypothetical protein VFC78_06505, partial [Tepidisphaeraceae bacterium]|nr:hypothetical protein [Tepidisphaeraceae bacterium]